MAPADKDYFLDDNQQLTDDQDKAAFLLIRKGQEVPKEMADKYGIGKVAPQSDDEPAKESVKAEKPSKNKSAQPTEDK